MAKKKLTEKDFWLQTVWRAEQDGKQYIFGRVRRRYAEDDIELKGSGEYIGTSRVQSFPRITDNDPDSDTFGERIEDKNASPIGTRMMFTDELTSENVKKYKAMCGVNGFGQTQYVWKFKQINISADLIDEFWTLPHDEAYNKYVLNQQVVKIEENQPNRRRKNP